MTPEIQTHLVTLLGYPVQHSLSPRMHNAAFAAQGLNWRYVSTPVHPSQLQEAVSGLKALSFSGANVTIPHKEAVMPWLDAISDRARHVGAVNTIVTEQDGDSTRLRGDNTDVAGFLSPLQSHEDALAGESMLVFGSGGAARAVIYALLQHLEPERLTIAARSPRKAEHVAIDMAGFDGRSALEVMPMKKAGPAVRESRLVVNATPLGMEPDEERTPWPEVEDFSEGQVVYDLVYAPLETRLLREAAARGARPIGGLEMLIAQAAAAYEQWTGRAMPVDVVREALREHAF